MLGCIMQAKSRSNSQPCCFASLWQINPSCGFVRLCVHSAPTAPVNHRCRFWMSFTGRWGPIWFDRWGEAYGLYHCITHTEGRESCYSCDTSDPLECTHTGSMHKDRQRPRQTQTLMRICAGTRFLDILYYCKAPVRSNEHSPSSSFRKRETSTWRGEGYDR